MINIPISVVIPAYNEGDWIHLPLESLAEQDFEGEFEIIVVDNGSTDATGAIARDLGARVIEEPRKGCTRAYQTGFEAANYPLIAATDADTLVSPHWLSEIEQSLCKAGVVGAYGPIAFHDASGYRNWLAKYGFRAFLKIHDWLDKPHFSGSNMAVSRRAFREVDGFDLSLNSASDVELSQRLHSQGEIVYNNEMTVQTSARRLKSRGIDFFIHHATNYFSVVWLNKHQLVRDFKDIR